MPTVPTGTDETGTISGSEAFDVAQVAATSWVGGDDVELVASKLAVFFLILQRTMAGDDPLVEAQGECGPFELVAFAAQDWFDEDVDPRTVEKWLDAGCWRADRVRTLVEAGVTPAMFYDLDGTPLLYDEARMYEPGEAPAALLEVAPLAVYVMDGEIAASDVRAVAARMR